MSKNLLLPLVFLFSIATAGPLWGTAPTTISASGEDIVYLSGQPNKTTLKGRAMDTDGNLKNIHFYINGPGYPGWNEVAVINVSGFDDDAEYEWTVPSSGTWSVHIRSYDLNNTADSNGNILNTFVAQSGVAPLTLDLIGDDIVYQSGQNVKTNLAGHATDANGDLDFMDFYYSSSGWQYIGTDQNVEGGDTYGVMPWAPPGAGTWSLHFRARDKTTLYDSNANIVRYVKARNPATSYNEATFVRFENLPYVLKPNETYTNVNVVMKNTGTKTWTSDGTPHRLGSQNPQDNTTWGLSRDAISANVAPGSEHTFTFNITAPGTAGEYNFQWRMVEDGVEWFGESSPEHTIVVEQDYATQNPSYTAGRDQDGDGWSNEGEARMGTSITSNNGNNPLKTASLSGYWANQQDGSKSTVVGVLGGSFAVNQSGGASYSIPISVPKGTAGMEPEVALVYDSTNQADGPFGLGWSLSGPLVITRGPATRANNQTSDPVDYDANDQFYLNGKLLVAISGNYGKDETEYRTLVDEFSRIHSYGQANPYDIDGGPVNFIVETKSGLIFHYGNTADSRVHGATPRTAEVLNWHLDKIEDLNGNFINFSYTDSSSTTDDLEQRINKITYTGNDSFSLAHYYEILFSYEDYEAATLTGGLYPEEVMGYYHGRRVRHTKRANSIKINYTVGTPYEVWRYDLKYVTDLVTRKPLLKSVTQVSGSSATEPITFVYGESSQGAFSDNVGISTQLYYNDSHDANDNRVTSGDFDGDGLTDMLVTDDGAWWLYRSTGSGFSRIGYGTLSENGSTADTDGMKVLDCDADGRSDIVAKYGSRVYFKKWNTSTNTWNTVAYSTSMGGYNAGSIVMDVDQDGKQEVFFTLSNGWEIWEVGTTSVIRLAYDLSSGALPTNNDVVMPIEYDDDGIPEILSASGSGSWSGHRISKFVLNGSGVITGLQHIHQLSSPDTTTHDIIPADFNGDGLTDLLYYTKSSTPDTGTEAIYISQSTGKGDGNYVTYFAGYQDFEKTEFALIDVDKNGTTDLVYAEETGSYTIQWKYRLYKDNAFQAALNYGSVIYTGPILDGSTVTGDFDGDGKLDIGFQRDYSGTSSDDIYAYLSKKPYILTTPLTGITDVLGAATSIEYTTLSSIRTEDAGFYTKGADTGGLVTMKFPYYAVNYVSMENGSSEDIETFYSYESYRIDPFRGPVGFEKMSTIRPAFWHPIGGFLYQTDYTKFKQDYPYTGMVKESGTLSTTGIQLSKSLVTTFATMDLNVSGAIKTVFPYISISEVTGADLNGTSLPKKITQTTYDPWGNPTEVKVTNYPNATSGTGEWVYETSNTNTFGSTDIEKELGRLTYAVVDHKTQSQTITKRTSYSYYTSANGYLLNEEITEPTDSALKLTKKYTYDGFGNVTKVTLSGSGGTINGQSTGITTRDQVITTYDTKGRFASSSKNAKNHTENYYYDLDDLKKGRQTRLQGANSRQTKFEYDAFNRLTKTTVNFSNGLPGTFRPVETVVTRGWVGGTYAPADAVYFVETTTQGGPPSIAFYNQIGQEVSKQGVLIDGGISRVDTLYNPLAQAYSVTQPFKSTGSFSWSSPGSVPIIDMEFDEMGRPKWQIVPDPGEPDGTVTYFEYGGLTTTITNPLGQKTRTTLDVNGNTIKVENNFDLASGADDRSEILYAYDAAGNLGSSTDAYSEVTTMTYDVRGRKTQMTDPNMGTWLYSYNVLGELIWQKDAVNNTSTLTYDTLGRITQRVDDPAAGSNQTTTWTYDTASYAVGKIKDIKYSDNSHIKTFTYSQYGDLATLETKTNATNAKIVKETYTYDSYGRLTTTAYAFNAVTEHYVKQDYSNLGFIYRIQQDADAAGGILPYTTVWEANAMDAWGNITTYTLGNGAKTVREFSAENGLLETIKTNYGSNPSDYIQDSAFVFDQIGNLTARASQAGWGTSETIEEFHYFDNLNRLIYTYANGRLEESMRYDKAGNILNRASVGEYHYDGTSPNAVSSIKNPFSGATLSSYSYNSNGAMTSRAGKTLTWTTFNKPFQIKDGSTVLSEFRYGFDRERIKQDAVGETIYYFGNVEWTFTSPTSTTDIETRIYLNAPSGRIGVHIKDANLDPRETRFFHTDHLGSIELVTNEYGVVLDRLSYTPWGQRRQDVWMNGDSFHKGVERRGFTGHEHLVYQAQGFELIHMNGRVYDPLLARFVSADPFADGLAASQTLNRYAYVGNNPVSFTDPSGHFITLILGFAFSHFATSVTAKVILGAVIGGLQAAISGGDWGDVLKGAVLGGIAAGVANGIGDKFGHNPAVFDFGNEFGRAMAHGISQGGISELGGGIFGDGFLGGMFGSIGSSLMSTTQFGKVFSTKSSRIFASAVIGGTASELGGGKFANGAMSGAFVAMFNHQGGNKEGFESQDAAAEYGARQIMQKDNQTIEWGFGIYKKAGRFFLTDITAGDDGGWNPGNDFFDHLDTDRMVALVHSHPLGGGELQENFSGIRSVGPVTHGLGPNGHNGLAGDIGTLYKLQVNGYLLTPSYKLSVARINDLPYDPVRFVKKYGYYQPFKGKILKDLSK